MPSYPVSSQHHPVTHHPRWYLRCLSLLCLGLLLGACSWWGQLPAGSSLHQSPNDDRQYRHLVLDNGLQVLLVQHPGADKAAASLSVFRGSYDEPDHRLGLAHYLEHMLFLGTEKYPDVDAYGSYIATHGGRHNAYTASDHTNYFFDIQPEYLEGALDRFAQFFIAPRFDAEYAEREKHAVHSEYQMQLGNDGWRGFATRKQVLNPAHPGSRFNIGSLETLSGEMREELLDFFAAHYSAHEMALVLVGSQPMSQLEAWVKEYFSAIPRRALVPAADPPSLFASDALPKFLQYQTLRQDTHLSLTFPIPALDAHYRTKPAQYIAELLGHEGPDSLHDVLWELGWIESLGASAGRADRNNATLSINLRLTATGLQHIDDIKAAVFAYIELIRQHGVEAWRYEEMAQLAALDFRFAEKSSPMNLAYQLSPRMALYPVNDRLVAPFLLEAFDADLIQEFLSHLRPDNVLVELAGPQQGGDAIEPWFGVPYAVQPLRLPPPEDLLANAQALPPMALPAPNPFVPEQLALVQVRDPQPRLLIEEPGLAIWLAQDSTFGAPRAATYLSIGLRDGLLTVEDQVHAALFARLLQHEFNAYAYPAEIAGLSYSIGRSDNGLSLQLGGYADKQILLAAEILQALTQLEIQPQRLAQHQDDLIRGYLNFRTDRVYNQVFTELEHQLLEGTHHPDVLAVHMAQVTPASLRAWMLHRLDAMQVTALLHGNLEATAPEQLAQVLRQALPLQALTIPEPRVQSLQGLGPLRQQVLVEQEDAALVLYFQAPDDSLAARAMLGLTARILRNAYFTALRTEQQLGYAVFTSPTLLHRRGGLSFAVQSPVAGPAELFQATRSFLENHLAVLQAMPASEFAAFQQGLISQLLESDQNLAQRSRRYWRDLEQGFYNFDSQRQLAALVADISQEDFLAFYLQLLGQLDNDRLITYAPGRFNSDVPGRMLQP